MLFNSVPFALFAVALFAIWPIVRAHPLARWVTLTMASLVFYGFHGATRWPSLIYILVAGAAVFGLARRIEVTKSRATLVFGLALTIGTLAVFKYAGLFVELVRGTPAHYPIPLAVSFISFQLASYLIDVYRGQLKATRSLWHFFAFVSFFPKLIAGPVVRGSVLLEQLAERRAAKPEQLWEGARQFSIGLFKKNVIADNLGPIVNVAFSVQPAQSCGYWWVMALLYTAQSYADFSGYSDMAIGLARILGFDIPPNFAHPFNAAGFREFWQRWHISVSSWFRDYLFFPLAKHWLPGVRPSLRPLVTHAILWIVMVVSGVWHGVAPGYAIWGALNAVYLSIETIYNWPARLSRTWPGRITAVLATVMLWAFSQIIFRATDLATALEIVRIMFRFDSFDLSEVVVDPRNTRELFWPALLAFVAIEHVWVALRRGPALDKIVDRVEPIFVAVLVAAAIVLRGPDAEFVYFKF
jgi:alginate O-acetyltransferase complex protein AlgI